MAGEHTRARRPRVVIVGAGFGGLTAAKKLATAPVDVTLIDQRNYHLFQPLLYQVATAGLSPADIAWPIRGIFSRFKNVRVVLAKAEGIDTDQRLVLTDEGPVAYDYLVLATGSRHSYFGRDEWAPYAPGLKRIVDATEVRKRILVAFERAEISEDPAERQRLLNFVIVGGGPTGVEMAGAIAELAHMTLARDFRVINPKLARITLVDANDRVLRAFPPALSAKAHRALDKLGVDVVLNKRVTSCGGNGVEIDGVPIPAGTIIWAAGVQASDAAKWADVDADAEGRIKVAPDLSLPGHPEIFAVGDTALVTQENGQPVPGIAPAAKQGGIYVARVIRSRLSGMGTPGPFRYRHLGNLATIGRHVAVIDFGRIRLSGWLAWWIWGIGHIYFLIGVRAPLLVAAQWFWSYLTYGKGARLITGLRPLFDTPPKAPKSAE